MRNEVDRFRCDVIGAGGCGAVENGVIAALTSIEGVVVESKEVFAVDTASSRPDGVFFMAQGFNWSICETRLHTHALRARMLPSWLVAQG